MPGLMHCSIQFVTGVLDCFTFDVMHHLASLKGKGIPLSTLRFGWLTQLLWCLNSQLLSLKQVCLDYYIPERVFSSFRYLLECLQKVIRMASWGEWMKAWMNFSLRKWQKWIQSKFKFIFLKFIFNLKKKIRKNNPQPNKQKPSW